MSFFMKLGVCACVAFVTLVLGNIIRQLLPQKAYEPPVVFHWIPIIGNAVEYGIDPYRFFKRQQKKHGDIFTFTLLGKQLTCYFGINGNEFILNGKHQDVSAEEIYSPLTTPVFGSNVIYDCPNSKLMEQKKFIKFGLEQKSLERYVPLISAEVIDYAYGSAAFQGESGVVNVTQAMAEITMFTAGRTLQGEEVRAELTGEFAALYHDLDMGFSPINFLLPWAPLPRNLNRDRAHTRMRSIYTDIIKKRRESGAEEGSDMIWNLMNCQYKSGQPVPDKEIAHLMIALLMAGQHTSSSAMSWIVLHLASEPDICDELYREQMNNLAKDEKLPPLQYADMAELPLLHNVVKETLRCHSSIHSIMRKVKHPTPVPGTPYVVQPDKVLLSSPLISALDEEYFTNGERWEPHRWDGNLHKNFDEYQDGEEKPLSRGTRSPYLPFGAGRHRCIGEKFAYINLGVITATLVRNFRFETMPGAKGVPKTDYTSLFSRPVQTAMVRWERRR